MDEKIKARLRVVSCNIAKHGSREDEVVEVKATGGWYAEGTQGGTKYPASLHITTYPGCGAIPVIGDYIMITVEQSTDQSLRGESVAT